MVPTDEDTHSIVLDIEDSCEPNKVFSSEDVTNKTLNNPENKVKKKLTTREFFTMVNLCCSGLSVGIYYAVLGPFFPQEAAVKGMSSTLIGVVFSEFELVIVLTSPIYGAYLTTIGAKHLYVCGLVISGGSAILFGILEYCPPGPIFTVMCLIVRTVEACGTAGYLTASYAIMVNTFPERVASMMGILSLFLGFGFTAAPPLGGLLYKLGGFKGPFLLTGSGNVTMGILSLIFIPPQSSVVKPGRSKMLQLLKLPVVLLMLLGICTEYICVSLENVALSLRLQRLFHFEPAIIGVTFLALPGVYAISTPIWGYVADKLPQYSTLFMLFGFILTGLSLFFMGPAPFIPIATNHLWLLLLTLGVIGFGIATIVVTFQVMSIAAMEAGLPQNLDTYGVISGLYTMSLAIGGLIGPILSGYLIDTLEFEWTCFIIGCVVLTFSLMLAIYILIVRPCVKSDKVAIVEVMKKEDSSLVRKQEENTMINSMPYGSTDSKTL